MSNLKGKTVFITGASAGIGEALTREFAAQGGNVVIAARRLDRLKALSSELHQKGYSILPVACDVIQERSLESAVNKGLETFGQIDIVVANAGFGVAGDFVSLKLEDYQRQFETNVFGVLRTLYASLDSLKKTKGTFVLIGSVSGVVALPGVSPYSMSKAAIHSLANSLSFELKKFGISVVLIAPGFVESEIRRVDNLGTYRPNAADPIPAWLKMPADRAAKKIVRAVVQKKREKIITLHGMLAIFIKRHFPGIINTLVRLGVRGRIEPR